MSSIYENIKERRLACGYTLLEVAEKLGVTEATMQRYESGHIKNIKHSTITSLAKILRCSPSYIMGWVEWHDDQYEDFVKASNKDKQILLERWGTPKRYSGLLNQLQDESASSDEPIDPQELDHHEQQLITDYRSLNKQGQEFIRQTMDMVKDKYKKDITVSDMEKLG